MSNVFVMNFICKPPKVSFICISLKINKQIVNLFGSQIVGEGDQEVYYKMELIQIIKILEEK